MFRVNSYNFFARSVIRYTSGSGRHSVLAQNRVPIYNQHSRQIHGSSPTTSSSASTFRERLAILQRNGTPEITIGLLILSVVGIDYALQTRTDNQRDDMYRELEREVRKDEEKTRIEDRRMLNNGTATKYKFQCIIRKVPQTFDGHKCLKDVKEGDIVGVIEEGVGPGGQYNLCSIERSTTKEGDVKDTKEGGTKDVSIGWFPCSCLEKIEMTQEIEKKQ